MVITCFGTLGGPNMDALPSGWSCDGYTTYLPRRQKISKISWKNLVGNLKKRESFKSRKSTDGKILDQFRLLEKLTTYPSLRAKCFLREGVDAQFPTNRKWSLYMHINVAVYKYNASGVFNLFFLSPHRPSPLSRGYFSFHAGSRLLLAPLSLWKTEC